MPMNYTKIIYHISLLLFFFTMNAMEHVPDSSDSPGLTDAIFEKIEMRKNVLLKSIQALDTERFPILLDTFDISKENDLVKDLQDIQDLLKTTRSQRDKESYLSKLSYDFYQVARLLMVKGFEKETKKVFDAFVSCCQCVFPTVDYRIIAEDLWHKTIIRNLGTIQDHVVALLEKNELSVAQEKVDFVLCSKWMAIDQNRISKQIQWFEDHGRCIKSAKKYATMVDSDFFAYRTQLQVQCTNIKNAIASSEPGLYVLASSPDWESFHTFAKSLIKMISNVESQKQFLMELAQDYYTVAHCAFIHNREDPRYIFQNLASLCDVVYRNDRYTAPKMHIIVTELWDTCILNRINGLQEQIWIDLMHGKELTQVKEKLRNLLKHTELIGDSWYSIEFKSSAIEWHKTMARNVDYARAFKSCSDQYRFIGSVCQMDDYYKTLNKLAMNYWQTCPELEQLKHSFGEHFSLLSDETEREQSLQVLFTRFPGLKAAFSEGKKQEQKQIIDLTQDLLPIDLTQEQTEETANGYLGGLQKRQVPKAKDTTETKRRKLFNGAAKEIESEKKKSSPIYNLLN